MQCSALCCIYKPDETDSFCSGVSLSLGVSCTMVMLIDVHRTSDCLVKHLVSRASSYICGANSIFVAPVGVRLENHWGFDVLISYTRTTNVLCGKSILIQSRGRTGWDGYLLGSLILRSLPNKLRLPASVIIWSLISDLFNSSIESMGFDICLIIIHSIVHFASPPSSCILRSVQLTLMW